MKLESNSWKVKTGSVLLFFMLHFSVFAQFPYELNSKIDYSLIGIGALSLTAGQVISNNVYAYTLAEINDLNPNDVNSFDRRSINNYSELSNNISEAVLLGSGLVSLSLLVDKTIRKEWVTMGVMGVEVLMLTYGLASVTKGAVLRARPYAYNVMAPLERKQGLDARYSFYSQSTAATAGISFFAAKVFVDSYPNSKWKPLVWGGAIVLPAITGWAKVAAGEHFTTDVLVGYSMGALIGCLIPVMHVKKGDSKVDLKIHPQVNGLAMKLTF